MKLFFSLKGKLFNIDFEKNASILRGVFEIKKLEYAESND